MNRRVFLMSGACAGLSCSRPPATGFPGHAFIANEESRSVAVVDLSTFRVAREIRIDGAPTAVVSHPRRPAVYVLTPATGTVHEIDPAAFTVRRKLHAAPSAVSMRLAGDSLWTLSREGRLLVEIKTDRFDVGARL